jgi:hypothetical protein
MKARASIDLPGAHETPLSERREEAYHPALADTRTGRNTCVYLGKESDAHGYMHPLPLGLPEDAHGFFE